MRNRFDTRRWTRRGFTMIEMIIAMTVLIAIFACAVPFLRIQARTVSDYGGRFDAQANARFAFSTVERQLRMAGVGVLNEQPVLVYLDTLALTFNADLATTDQNDASATYFNPSLAAGDAVSWPLAQVGTLPRGGGAYPLREYMSAPPPLGIRSVAETVSFWVSQDSTVADARIHVLWRRVNGGTPRVVARNVMIRNNQPLFRYFMHRGGALVEIPKDSLPIKHVATHGSSIDTARVSWADSVRVIRMQVTSVYNDPQQGWVERTVAGNIRLLNAGLVQNSTCGETPFGSAIATAYDAGTMDDPPFATITWTASADEAGGEQDVQRYVLFRRVNGAAEWGEPYVSLPSSGGPYSFTDFDVSYGQTVQYAIGAQDCTPATSGLALSGTINVTPP